MREIETGKMEMEKKQGRKGNSLGSANPFEVIHGRVVFHPFQVTKALPSQICSAIQYCSAAYLHILVWQNARVSAQLPLKLYTLPHLLHGDSLCHNLFLTFLIYSRAVLTTTEDF